MTPSPARPWLVLLGLTLGVCASNGFARFAYGLIMPAMKEDLGWNYVQSGWLNTANALGYVVGSLVTMALIHRVTPSRLFALGTLATSLCLLATGFDEALWAQSLWRVLAGVFGALSFVAGGVLAASLFQDNPKRNALAIALYFGTGGGLGIVLSGALIPPLLGLYGPQSWPWAWIMIGIVSLAFCPMAMWSAGQLKPPVGSRPPKARVPSHRMLGEYAGYAGFGLGYIVYLTFIAAWMKEQAASPLLIATVWMVMGAGIMASPFAWRSVFARYASGVPLALVLTGIAMGSALPILSASLPVLLASAIIFGLSVFMAPGAITNFTRQNLPQAAWGAAVSQFTLVFAVAQTIGPIGAGLLGDFTGDIGNSLLAAAGVLMLGAGLALTQKPLVTPQDRFPNSPG